MYLKNKRAEILQAEQRKALRMPGERESSSPSSRQKFWRALLHSYMEMYLSGGGIVNCFYVVSTIGCDTYSLMANKIVFHQCSTRGRYMEITGRHLCSLFQQEKIADTENFIITPFRNEQQFDDVHECHLHCFFAPYS